MCVISIEKAAPSNGMLNHFFGFAVVINIDIATKLNTANERLKKKNIHILLLGNILQTPTLHYIILLLYKALNQNGHAQ